MFLQIRYYAKTNTYYIQTRGPYYYKLEAEKRRWKAEMYKLQRKGGNESKLNAVQIRVEELRKEKSRKERFYKIERRDIPAAAVIKPITHIYGTIISEVDPDTYSELLRQLVQKVHAQNVAANGRGW